MELNTKLYNKWNTVQANKNEKLSKNDSKAGITVAHNDRTSKILSYTHQICFWRSKQRRLVSLFNLFIEQVDHLNQNRTTNLKK